MSDNPTMPPRMPRRDPARWAVDLARAAVAGRIDAQRARAMLEERAASVDAKTAAWMRHRVAALIMNVLPPDAPGIVAGCVADAEARLAAVGGLLPYAPGWVRETRGHGGERARLYARLYFFADALGADGRDFIMARCVAARLFDADSGDIAAFIGKATRRGFMVRTGGGRQRGGWKTAHVYRLAACGGILDDARFLIHGLLAERLPEIAGGGRCGLAQEVTGVYRNIRAEGGI